MPKTNKVSINKDKEGRYRTNIPKAIADAMELEGKKLEWKIESSNRLVAKVIDE